MGSSPAGLGTAVHDVLAEGRRQIEEQMPALGVPISAFNLFIYLFCYSLC